MSTDSTLRKAAKLAQSGDRAGAAALYQQVLARFPGNVQAKRGLAALAAGAAPAQKRRGGAPTQRAAPMAPAPAMAQMQALTQAFERGDLARTLAEGQRLALLFPKAPGLLNLLTLAFARSNRHEDAVAWADRTAKADPNFAGAFINKASSLVALGRLDDAIKAARAALRLNPGLVQAHLYIGYALVNSDRAKEGEAAFRLAIRMAPDLPEAHIGLGNALVAQFKPEDALAVFETAAKMAPDNVDIANNIGNALAGLGRYFEATEVFSAAVASHPRHPDLRGNFARALRDSGRAEQAIEQCKAALDLTPGDAGVWGMLASCYAETGDKDQAAIAVERALEINPRDGTALAIRWQFEPLPMDHPQFDIVTELAASDEIEPADRVMLEYTLFRSHDAAGNTETAIKHLKRSNAFRREANPYDLKAVKQMFSDLKAAFPVGFAPLSAQAADDIPAPTRPILIVGMPRSGTTLTEQILASHSQVYGAGELAFLKDSVADHGWRHNTAGGSVTEETIRDIRAQYIEKLAQLDFAAPVVTDKMPLNFRWLGFFLAAFPDSPVFFLRRDPRATCWSNYSNTFSGNANNFGCDQGDVAEMYRAHLDLMAHWAKVFPGRITDVFYERLTENQEEETRRLIATAGLDWEDACLEFHKTKRAVRTVSAMQVRQKMYTGSSEAWRKYEDYLGPMLAGLDGVTSAD